MHESDKNQLLKWQRALLLAASDMHQAIAAVEALEHEPDGNLSRALETAFVVTFCRPFTKSDLMVDEQFIPEGDYAEVIEFVKKHRDKRFAHTDTTSGRRPRTISVDIADGRIGMRYREDWIPLKREGIPDIIAMCARLADHFEQAAALIQLRLEDRSLPRSPA